MRLVFLLVITSSFLLGDVLNFKRSDLQKVSYIQDKRKPLYKPVNENNYTPSKVTFSKEIAYKKDEIFKSIDSYTNDDFYEIYNNVLTYMEKNNSQNLINYIKNPEIITFLKEHYKSMLKTIAYNESGFKHTVGLMDPNDVSYFQINIKKNIWPLSKLENITNTNQITREQLIEDYNFAGKVALHVLIYNTGLYASINKINTPNESHLIKFIASYNNPTKLKDYYMQSAKSFLASL